VPVVVPSGENAILAAPGANLALTIDDIERARDAIAASDALLVQFETPIETVERAVAIAAAAGTRVILNPAPVREFDASLLSAVSVLVVNEVEATMLAGRSGLSHEQEAEALLAKGPVGVVVTLGPDGGVWARGGEAGRFGSFQVTAIDSVGAGDCFCGALAVALCEGRDLPEAIQFAAAAAAISVTRAGAAASMPDREEVRELFSG
jgi:ribokinase